MLKIKYKSYIPATYCSVYVLKNMIYLKLQYANFW